MLIWYHKYLYLFSTNSIKHKKVGLRIALGIDLFRDKGVYTMCRYILKTIYLEKSKRLII